MSTQTSSLNKINKSLVHKKLYVRYMVSLRCKMIVRKELKKLGFKYSILTHGAIEFLEEATQEDLNALRRNLRESGLELLDVHESRLVDRIIDNIIEVIHYFDELPKLSYSEIIAQNFGETSDSVLKIFSEVVGMSVIQFIVVQKIERAKVLLLYDNLSLIEISKKLRYKSKDIFIAQFKKITGLDPHYFIKLKEERIKNISDVQNILT